LHMYRCPPFGRRGTSRPHRDRLAPCGPGARQRRTPGRPARGGPGCPVGRLVDVASPEPHGPLVGSRAKVVATADHRRFGNNSASLRSIDALGPNWGRPVFSIVASARSDPRPPPGRLPDVPRPGWRTDSTTSLDRGPWRSPSARAALRPDLRRTRLIHPAGTGRVRSRPAWSESRPARICPCGLL
jgi:hypothetical protein